MEQVLSSEWLRGTPLPREAAHDQDDWVTLPTRINGTTCVPANMPPSSPAACQACPEEDGAAPTLAPATPPHPIPAAPLMEIEVLARERLAALGIGAALLNEHLDKGVRSPVIGTYRIAVHRLQKQASSQPTTPENGSGPGDALQAVSVDNPQRAPSVLEMLFTNLLCLQDSNGRSGAASHDDRSSVRHSMQGRGSHGLTGGSGTATGHTGKGLFRKAKSAAPKQTGNGQATVRSRTCVLL